MVGFWHKPYTCYWYHIMPTGRPRLWILVDWSLRKIQNRNKNSQEWRNITNWDKEHGITFDGFLSLKLNYPRMISYHVILCNVLCGIWYRPYNMSRRYDEGIRSWIIKNDNKILKQKDPKSKYAQRRTLLNIQLTSVTRTWMVHVFIY